MANTPEGIGQLVNRFDRNLAAYKSPQYNETELRVEFVNPFWSALGWDMENKAGHAMAYRDVIHEDAVKVGTATKAPDYCFRIGGARKFFLETKRPSRDLKADPAPAYQLRRYGWSAKLPLSVLTDFEELIVYDCRVRPRKTDKSSQARILCIHFKDYLAKWEELNSIFSHEAVLKGSFDRYVESVGGKRGTAEVDTEFLKEIEGWRDALARNIALRNLKLTDRELNFAVQITIDRIIFLRMCEDRGIERYGRLQALCGGPRIYPRLVQIYREADERYNSGLFHFEQEKDQSSQPDELTPRLAIDDKALKDILSNLYYPDSPYEFRILPPEILGNVYEQFLGKVIRLTAGHQAKVEEKPEVRKAGGVYYTPSYIVDYIVKNTVGRLLGLSIPSPSGEGKPACNPPVADSIAGRGEGPAKSQTPAQVSALRILDPACGSGSFLLGAYQYLLDWHLKAYLAEKEKTGKIPTVPPEAGQRRRKSDVPVMYQGYGGDYLLTTVEKKRILLNNIYGVDIDPQAVEVTKLSLLLKVLENENQDSLRSQLTLWRERALPDLSGNIKCGNSLIGPDFYQNQQLPLLAEEDKYRINAFDWNDDKQGFGAIMRAGGFDAVIGNPPYILLQDECRDDRQLDYFRSKFASASYKIDTYHLFIEHAIRVSRVGGHCSMIIPANILTNNHLDKLRRLMLERSVIQHILVIDGGVFQGISVDNVVFVVSPGKPTSKSFDITHAQIEAGQLNRTSTIPVSPDSVLADKHALFTGTSGGIFAKLWKKIEGKSWTLGKIADVNFGKQLRDRKKFVKDVISVSSVRAIPASHRPCYTGRDVNRYKLIWGGLACLNDEVARCGGCWDSTKHDTKNKLLTRQIGRYPDFAIDYAGWHCLNTMFLVTLREAGPNPRYVLGILNSKLMHALWLDRFYDQRRTFPKIKGTYLKKLPVQRIDISNAADKSRHDRIVALVDSMLDLHKKVPAAKTPDEKTRLEREITATDRQIDALVYELYGLTEEDIRIVERSP